MNILFIDPPSLDGGAVNHATSAGRRAPHMGLLYMATYLKSKTDASVRILDMPTCNINLHDLAQEVQLFEPDLVAITARTFHVLGAYRAASVIKSVRPSAVTLIGGAHGSALPTQTLEECPDFDAVGVGEGELTLLDVYSRVAAGWRSKKDIFEGVDGVVWRDDSGEVIQNEPRKLIADLDSLPLPDLSLVPYSRYSKTYNPREGTFEHYYPVSSSRGCPFNCTYCYPLLTRKHRVRSVESVLEEIELLHSQYNARRIYFEDSIFYLNKKWLASFCEGFTKRDLHRKIRWGFETRVDVADKEMFNLVTAAGCTYLFFGQESGNEYVLSKANKRYRKEQIIEAIRGAKDSGIESIRAGIILGLPYETKATIEETLSLLQALPYDQADVNMLMPYPGTRVFDMADKGEGGLRWIEGKRMNWKAYSRDRSEPLVEVNDLSAADLLEARDRGRKIVSSTNKMSFKARNRKRTAYIKELAKHDQMRLLWYTWETVRGIR